jgi:hypothetical protein
MGHYRGFILLCLLLLFQISAKFGDEHLTPRAEQPATLHVLNDSDTARIKIFQRVIRKCLHRVQITDAILLSARQKQEMNV